tara:strand:+ start:758 stop:940 length:183 start_codon:yes stop_codon:yes gene_type:complete
MKQIKNMNLEDIKMGIAGAAGVWLNLGQFNDIIAAFSGVVILGYTVSRWYYLTKENRNNK